MGSEGGMICETCGREIVVEKGAREGDYREARIGAAMALTIVLMILPLWDAWDQRYEISPVAFFGLIIAILVLLGREVPAILRPGK